jgi:hypothetical protein
MCISGRIVAGNSIYFSEIRRPIEDLRHKKTNSISIENIEMPEGG